MVLYKFLIKRFWIKLNVDEFFCIYFEGLNGVYILYIFFICVVSLEKKLKSS